LIFFQAPIDWEAEAKLPEDISIPNTKPTADEMLAGDIFLTGATGFIGAYEPCYLILPEGNRATFQFSHFTRHILRYLLSSVSGKRIHCLVRAKDSSSAVARLASVSPI
jgi:hypothetical protein